MVSQLLHSLLLCALLAPIPPAPSASAEKDDLLFASPTTRDHIGRVVVPVTLNGQGPFRFIVDTGANHSTISPQLAVVGVARTPLTDD